MWRPVSLLLFLYVPKISAEGGEQCVTPNGEKATCVPTKTCHVLLDALKEGNASVIDFIEKSQCLSDEEPLVCCGPSAHYTAQNNLISEVFLDKTACGLPFQRGKPLVSEVDLSDHPWIAALGYASRKFRGNSGIKCGGSIISNRYILTAASCLNSSNYELSTVVLGERRLSTDPDCEIISDIGRCAERVQKFNIEDTILHPQYNAQSLEHDIALIRLDKEIRYSDYVRPICLPTTDISNLKLSSFMEVAGWRILDDGTPSDTKLKGILPLKSIEACKPKFERNVTLTQLCAGGKYGKDACNGNYGGPLMRTYFDQNSKERRWYQEGVTSLGPKCGNSEYPFVYTNIWKYTNWIRDVISSS